MARLSLALVVAFVASGCGTIGNMADRGTIYGGVGIDCKAVCDAREDLVYRPEVPVHSTCNDVAIVICRSIDVPFSAVLDTLTLPLTTTIELCTWLKGDRIVPDILAPGLKDREMK